MKKLIEKTLVTVAACGMAALSLAVSCQKIDETALNDRIDAIEDRLDALEADFKAQLESIQQLLTGSTVVSCELGEDGIYTIVLSDGETTIKVPAASENPDGVVGVVQEGDTYYWTLDGEPILVNKEKVPVSVTPGIRVNEDSNMWEISPDGGKTWLDTGMEAVAGTSIFSKVEEDDEAVYFTLSDGTKIKAEKARAAECVILAGKQYVEAGQEISVNLSIGNVSKTTIVKPDGWKVSISGNTLKITAPETENLYAETEGTISLFVFSGSQLVTVAEVNVEVGVAPVSVSVQGDEVTFDVSSEKESDYSWPGYYYGVTRYADFSPEAVYASLENNDRAYAVYYDQNYSLKDLVGTAYDENESYVVWALEAEGDDTYQYLPADASNLIYQINLSAGVTFYVNKVTFEDADMSVQVTGASSYYAGVFSEADYNAETIVSDLNTFPDASLQFSGNYDGKLSGYGTDYAEDTIIAGTTYIAFAIPVKAEGEYTVADIFSQTIEIPALVQGGDVSVSFGEVTSSPTSVEVAITPDENTYKFYYMYMTADEYSHAYATEEQRFAKLLESGTSRLASEGAYTYKKSSLSPAAEGYILAVAIDETGKAGKVQEIAANTPAIEYSDVELSVEIVELGIDEVTLRISGEGVKSLKYIQVTQSDWINNGAYQGDKAKIEERLAVVALGGYYSDVKSVFYMEGTYELNIPGLDTGVSYHVGFVGIDANDKPTHMADIEFKPGIPDGMFVKSDDAAWTANQSNFPVASNIAVNGTPIGEMTGFPTGSGVTNDVTLDVKAGDNCARMWILVTADKAYISGISEEIRASEVMSQYYTKEIEGNSATGLTFMVRANAYLFMMWQDTEGKYYYYTEQDLSELFAPSEEEPETPAGETN